MRLTVRCDPDPSPAEWSSLLSEIAHSIMRGNRAGLEDQPRDSGHEPGVISQEGRRGMIGGPGKFISAATKMRGAPVHSHFRIEWRLENEGAI